MSEGERTAWIAHAVEGASEALGQGIAELVDSPAGDCTAQDVGGTFGAVGRAERAVASGAEAWRTTESAVSAEREGDGRGAASGRLGAGAGTAGHVASAHALVATCARAGVALDSAHLARSA